MYVKLCSYECSGEQACVHAAKPAYSHCSYRPVGVRHLLRLRRALRQARRRAQGLHSLLRRTARLCAPRSVLQQMPCENPCCLQNSVQRSGNTHWYGDLCIRMCACALKHDSGKCACI